MIAATAMKMNGSTTQVGSPLRLEGAEVDQFPPVRSISTGNALMTRRTAQSDGRPDEQVGPSSATQEPEPDTEEAPEQDEVREVRQVDDVRAGPADQDELDEEHQEAGEEELESSLRIRRSVRVAGGPDVEGGARYEDA